jgi:hypothetical protein
MLGRLAWRGFSLLFDLVSFVAVVGIAAIRDGAFLSKPSEEDKTEFTLGTSDQYSKLDLILHM